jgi:hypothetical protein
LVRLGAANLHAKPVGDFFQILDFQHRASGPSHSSAETYEKQR